MQREGCRSDRRENNRGLAKNITVHYTEFSIYAIKTQLEPLVERSKALVNLLVQRVKPLVNLLVQGVEPLIDFPIERADVQVDPAESIANLFVRAFKTGKALRHLGIHQAAFLQEYTTLRKSALERTK